MIFTTTKKNLSNILLSKITTYPEEIIGDRQCGFRRRNRPIMIIYSVFVKYLRKLGNTTKAVRQLFIDPKKAYDSVRREVLYNIFIGYGVPMKLVRLIKMCLNETFSTVRIGKNLSDMFPTRNGLKQGDALSPLLFNFALEYAITRIRVNQDGLKLNSIQQLLVYADVNILGRSVHTIKMSAY